MANYRELIAGLGACTLLALSSQSTLAAPRVPGENNAPDTKPTGYQQLDNLNSVRTLQSAGVHWSVDFNGLGGQAADTFGSGTTYTFDPQTGAISVATPTGITGVFTSVDFAPQLSTSQTKVYSHISFSPSFQIQQLRVTKPTVDGVALEYTLALNFFDASFDRSASWISIAGDSTVARAMPKTGTATYAVGTGGTMLAPPASFPAPFTQYDLTGPSTGTFSANFGTGAIDTSLHLIGVAPTGGAPVDFGTFTGSGAIAAGTSGFSGSFAGTTGAGFSGGFFGPNAKEMGYGFNFKTGDLEAFGVAVGIKK
jgi:hypothetical protein